MGCAGSGTRGSGRGDKKAPGLAGADSEAGWWRMGKGHGPETERAAREAFRRPGRPFVREGWGGNYFVWKWNRRSSDMYARRRRGMRPCRSQNAQVKRTARKAGGSPLSRRRVSLLLSR